MEVIWINKVNYRVDEQALQGQPAHSQGQSEATPRVYVIRQISFRHPRLFKKIAKNLNKPLRYLRKWPKT